MPNPFRSNSTLRASKPMARSRLRQRSAKKVKAMRLASKQTRQLIAERGNRCELQCSPDCRGVAEGRHHLRKQGQGGSDDASNVLLACNVCNQAVEDHPLEAHAMGLVVKSWEARAEL